MNLFQAIILGILQGLCEFLPVSSSGHLVLMQNIFGLQEGTVFFDIMLHVGTLIAVAVCFRKTLLKMVKQPLSKYPAMIVLATLPTVVIALLFKDSIESFFDGRFLGVCFLITAVILWLSERIAKSNKALQEMRPGDALLMGVMQGVAVVPGISRSGSTIAGGLFAGLDRSFAAEFSFMMSIPAILGSLVLEIPDVMKDGLGDANVLCMIAGMAAAAISGYFAINVMLKIVRKGSLMGFAIYCALLGLLVLIDQNATHIFL